MADGSIISLVQNTPSYIQLYTPSVLQSLFTISTTCPAASSLTIYPQTVGAYTQIQILNLVTNAILTAGDRIMLTFPSQFEFHRNNLDQISSSWDGG
jgi:hypothetical protein